MHSIFAGPTSGPIKAQQQQLLACYPVEQPNSPGCGLLFPRTPKASTPTYVPSSPPARPFSCMSSTHGLSPMLPKLDSLFFLLVRSPNCASPIYMATYGPVPSPFPLTNDPTARLVSFQPVQSLATAAARTRPFCRLTFAATMHLHAQLSLRALSPGVHACLLPVTHQTSYLIQTTRFLFSCSITRRAIHK